jgi:hypothetical protein
MLRMNMIYISFLKLFMRNKQIGQSSPGNNLPWYSLSEKDFGVIAFVRKYEFVL